MILIDFSQVFISNAIMQLSKEKSKSIELDLLRHMIFNSIRSYLVKFRKDFGSEVIIAIDNKNTWRKSVFPQYKANRKKSKDTLNIDWDDLYHNLSIIENELRDNTPYKVLKVDECEADDIIASIAIKYSDFNKILIVSGDNDFLQLQKYENVYQYNPIKKISIKCDDARKALMSKLIEGDRGDGIPNFLSSDNSFVDGIRQKSITQINLEKWLNQDPSVFCVTGEMQRNWARNKMLIDFDEIPFNIQVNILNVYQEVETQTKKAMVKYFMENRMIRLLEVIEEF